MKLSNIVFLWLVLLLPAACHHLGSGEDRSGDENSVVAIAPVQTALSHKSLSENSDEQFVEKKLLGEATVRKELEQRYLEATS